MLKLIFFARLREALGVSAEEIHLPDNVRDVAALQAWLRARGEAWASELAPGRPVRVAVNHALAEGKTVIADGDEVAFFPPVTGG